jgi:hypothetical protein
MNEIVGANLVVYRRCLKFLLFSQMSPHAKVSPASVTPAKPLLSLSVDSPVLGTAYALCAPHHTPAVSASRAICFFLEFPVVVVCTS